MSLEEFVSSLNNEQLECLFNLTQQSFQSAVDLQDCVEFAMELRGLV